jgi:transposase
MIGPVQQSEPKLFHYGINLEKRVRTNNPLRGIKGSVDFSFVRARVGSFYGKDGHQSEDPIVILKLMLLLFMDDVSSERELMRIVGERLDYMWFLDFDLDDEIPNHSVLSKARKRWGGEVFEELFVTTVRQCVEAGLVDGEKIHMDGSFVEANASRGSVRKGPPELIDALRQAYRKQAQKLEEPDEGDSDDGVRKRVAVSTVSATDPDAAVARKTDGDPPRLRYKNHRAVDDQRGVITAIETTPGNVLENHKLMALIQQHERNTAEKVRTVVADAQYGTNENFAACQEQHIRSHMKDLRSTFRNDAAKRGIFGESDFRYNEETETYRCPAGEQLKRSKTIDRGFYVFKSDPKLCEQCPLRVRCLKSKKHIRTLKRHVAHEQIQQARAESHSGWARRDRKRRKHLMEGSFADATNQHGFKRARWRRLNNQRIQDLLIASCQNIRLLVNSTSHGYAAAMALELPNGAFRLPVAQIPELQLTTRYPGAAYDFPWTSHYSRQRPRPDSLQYVFGNSPWKGGEFACSKERELFWTDSSGL